MIVNKISVSVAVLLVLSISCVCLYHVGNARAHRTNGVVDIPSETKSRYYINYNDDDLPEPENSQYIANHFAYDVLTEEEERSYSLLRSSRD